MRIRVILCLYFVLLLIAMLTAGKKIIRYMQTNSNTDEERIEAIEYIREGVKAIYPRFVADMENEKLSKINELILKDFNKILQIYSFYQVPEPVPTPARDEQIPTILNISFQVKLNNPLYTSIYYLASYNSPYAAHPTNLVYTTNIDKSKGSRMVLGDIVKLDADFADSFRSWKLVNVKQYPEYIKQGIADYLSDISNEDLLAGMKTADIIGSGNLLDMYSYLTDDSLGISIGLPNYLGDHVELESDYNSLKPYLKPDINLVR